jgi:hypothetical protein
MSSKVTPNARLLVSDAKPARYLWAPLVPSFLMALALCDLDFVARLFKRVDD